MTSDLYVNMVMGEEHMPVSKLNSTIIEAAIIGFEHQKTQIDSQIAELRAMLNGSTPTVTATPEAPAPKRKKFSAAAIQRMREAQQRRWAKVKGKAKIGRAS